MSQQKSDRLIVAMKPAKTGGAKGMAVKTIEETKHAEC